MQNYFNSLLVLSVLVSTNATVLFAVLVTGPSSAGRVNYQLPVASPVASPVSPVASPAKMNEQETARQTD